MDMDVNVNVNADMEDIDDDTVYTMYTRTGPKVPEHVPPRVDADRYQADIPALLTTKTPVNPTGTHLLSVILLCMLSSYSSPQLSPLYLVPL